MPSCPIIVWVCCKDCTDEVSNLFVALVKIRCDAVHTLFKSNWLLLGVKGGLRTLENYICSNEETRRVSRTMTISAITNRRDAKLDFCSNMLGAKQDFCPNILGAKQDFCPNILKFGYKGRLLFKHFGCKARLLFKHVGCEARLLFKLFGCKARLLFKPFGCKAKLFLKHCGDKVRLFSNILNVKKPFTQTFLVQSNTFVQPLWM